MSPTGRSLAPSARPLRARACEGSPAPLDALALAVEIAGGTSEDYEDLLEVWERLGADRYGHAARLAYEARHPRCSCADGGELGAGDARCARCCRLPAGGVR